jgi:hypothetical protein|tara:strand:+ start:189 stop:497 length:309 start_codon:yes stop_codon:yes gene_type:complete
MKETTIITSEGEAEVYETVDAFFDAHNMSAWRAKELKLFTDAGFDVLDSSKMMAQLSEDKTSVIVTVEFADQAEKDAIIANMTESDPEHDGILTTLSNEHLF